MAWVRARAYELLVVRVSERIVSYVCVKPRQELRHRRYKADCSVERGARSGDERALDRKVAERSQQGGWGSVGRE